MTSSPSDTTLPVSSSSKKLTLCLEINPPRGCDASTIFEKLDTENLSHIDVFNVTDCALAKLKLHASTFAAHLKRRYQKRVVVNLTCRDRNLLGLESEILGASFSGIDGIVAITGDAMSIGDTPERKGVFEVNSVKLMETITKLNAGIDSDGRKIKGATKIAVCGVASPHTTNQAAELKRLRKKKEAGATFILTQPVFDAATTKDFFSEAKNMGLHMIAGLMAFRTPHGARQSQSVPGVKAPMDRYANMSPDTDISEQTISECLQTVKALKDVVDGFHIIAGGNLSLALKLARQVSEEL